MWWRPDSPDDRLPGTLRTHESRAAELSLTGEWRRPDGTRIRESRVICGLADRLGWVVLVDCGPLLPGETFAGSQHRTVGFRRTHCRAHTVLAGDDLGPDCRLEFGRVSVEFSHLTEWAYTQGVSEPFDRKMTPYDEHRDGFMVTVPRAAELTATVADLTIVIRPWVATRPFSPLGLKAEPKLYVVLERPTTEGLDRWHDAVNDMREFFSFLTGIPIRSKHTWASVLGSAGIPPTTVEVHEPRSQADPFWANVRGHDMLVEYKEFAYDFKTHVERWMQRKPELARACRQFLVARDGTKYAEQRFLSLARALEVLHASQEGRGCLLEASQFAHIKESLEAVVQKMSSGGVQEALTKRLGDLNQASFQNRVCDLLNSACDHLQLSPPGAQPLAKEIAAWRNGFTHLRRDRVIGDSAASERVFRLGQLMEVTFETCMLPLLGFSTAAVHAIIQRKLQHRWPYVRELISRAGGSGIPA